MDSYKRLLLANKAWIQEQMQLDPAFFGDLAREQKPEFLWIGCSDSRVPAEEITGARPGEIFVHRNIANMVVSTDLNLLCVLSFAIEHLKIKHIIVCGHYGCGGVRAAMEKKDYGVLNKWLRGIKDVYHNNATEIESLQTQDSRFGRLVELNVREQVKNISRTAIVQKAWREQNGPTLHGWVYGLENGRIEPLCLMEPGPIPEPIYQFDLEES